MHSPASTPRTPAPSAIPPAAGLGRAALAKWNAANAAFWRAEHPPDFAALVLAADTAEAWQSFTGLRTPYGTGRGY